MGSASDTQLSLLLKRVQLGGLLQPAFTGLTKQGTCLCPNRRKCVVTRLSLNLPMAADESFTPLNLIKGYKDGMKVRVKVFHLWQQRYMNNPSNVASIDMILMDQQLIEKQVETSTEQEKKIQCLLNKVKSHEKVLIAGMTRLQESISKTTIWDTVASSSTSPKMSTYMSQMSKVMGNLGAVEDYLHQADSLRETTLIQLHEILTTRQSALALLAISDYYGRLNALSTLWVAKPRESPPT